MARIGRMMGVAPVFGLPLSGPQARWRWRARCVSQALVLGLGRELHIFGKWTSGVFFPTDLTNRRFPGSHAMMRAERGGLADVAATATPLRG